MTRVLRWCTLAGITALLLGLAVPASAQQAGWTPAGPGCGCRYVSGSSLGEVVGSAAKGL
jgi:hypothetical protein